MGTYTQYSAVASSNNGATPVGAPEGCNPGSINDILRELMSVVRTLGDSIADGTLPGSGTPLPLARGGTGATTAALARTALGLGSAALATVGTGPTEIPTNANVVGQVPVGGIIMWWGTIWTWPANYLPCDGNSGTPDLRGRVPVCPSGDFGFQATGGAATATTSSAGTHAHAGQTDVGGNHSHGGVTGSTAIDISQMPAHTHAVLQNIAEGGTGRFASGGNGQSTTTTTTATGGNGGHDHTIAASGNHQHPIAADGGHSHTVDVRQPWVGLWFLIRVS